MTEKGTPFSDFNERGNILIIDDLPENLHLLTCILTGQGHEVWPVADGTAALETMIRRQPDLVILDVRMPGMDGFDVCKKMKADAKLSRIPVIFISALVDTEDKVRAFQAGAVDYITKPFQKAEVLVRVNTHLSLGRLQRHAEKTLHQAENRYKEIYDATSEAIYIYDTSSNNIIDINRTTCELTGYSREEILKMKAGDMSYGSPPYSKKELMEYIELAINEGPQQFDWIVRKKSGDTVWVEITMNKSSIHSGEVLIIVGRDISERKEAEAEKEKLEEQLRQAQKIEAIGTLAGGIAHDFNNILSPIFGYTEFALDHISHPEKLKGNLDEIIKAAGRARELVRQILTFSRRADSEKEPLMISSILNEALKLLRATLPTTIEIRQDISTEKKVLADPVQIRQIVMNLCTNSYQAMRSSGVLSVTLKEAEDAELKTFPEYRDRSVPYIQLRIADTGHGIEKQSIENIFEPYFSTKDASEGTGLGLSVVYGIVQKHNGFIQVESEPGRGTAFDIYFPVCPEGADKSEKSEKKEKLVGGKERVMVVDDEETISNMIKEILTDYGYDIDVYTDAIDALNAFEDQPEKYDLVITDMTMPQLTGTQLAQKILAKRPGVPIILTTGHSEWVDRQKAKEMGIRAYVEKPLRMRELVKTVRGVLNYAKSHSG